MSTSIFTSLSSEFSRLTPEQQNQVLEFVRQLKSTTNRERRKQAILESAGTVPADGIERMRQAIAEGCEQINPHGW
jgi:hypothetical protein